MIVDRVSDSGCKYRSGLYKHTKIEFGKQGTINTCDVGASALQARHHTRFHAVLYTTAVATERRSSLLGFDLLHC